MPHPEFSPKSTSFLGTGWSFPPSFYAQGAQVQLVSGTEDIHQSLQILLSTQLGERVMQEDYGSDLSQIQFEDLDQGLINTVARLVSDAILYHEPRIQLEQVQVTEDTHEPGQLWIRIDYSVRSTNSRFNMVYPFHLHEANPQSTG